MRNVAPLVATLLLSSCVPNPGFAPGSAGCSVTPPASAVPFVLGNMTKTGDAFDWSLDGPGYFRVRDAKTERVFYTRRGTFTLDATGTVVLREGAGLPLEPMVTVPMSATAAKTTVIMPNGFVLVPFVPDPSLPPMPLASPPPGFPPGMDAVSQIQLAMFPDPSLLTVGPDGLLSAPVAVCPVVTPPGRLAFYRDHAVADIPWDATGSVVSRQLETVTDALRRPTPSR